MLNVKKSRLDGWVLYFVVLCCIVLCCFLLCFLLTTKIIVGVCALLWFGYVLVFCVFRINGCFVVSVSLSQSGNLAVFCSELLYVWCKNTTGRVASPCIGFPSIEMADGWSRDGLSIKKRLNNYRKFLRSCYVEIVYIKLFKIK